jgi:hypothetical protein
MVRKLKAILYLAPAFAIAFSASAWAQDTSKALAGNSKVTVTERTLPAGTVVAVTAPEEAYFVRYYLTGGTVEYTYADGTKQVVNRTAGTAVIVSSTEKRPTSAKNIGKTTLRSVVVSVK